MYPQVTIVFKELDIIIVVSLHEDVAEKVSLAEVWRVLHAMDNELENTIFPVYFSKRNGKTLLVDAFTGDL